MNIGNMIKKEARATVQHRVRQTVKQVRRAAEKAKRKKERKKEQAKLAEKRRVNSLKEKYRRQLLSEKD